MLKLTIADSPMMPRDKRATAIELERQAALEPSLAKSQALAFEADRVHLLTPNGPRRPRLTLTLFRN
jgi:hypothetical protein